MCQKTFEVSIVFKKVAVYMDIFIKCTSKFVVAISVGTEFRSDCQIALIEVLHFTKLGEVHLI